ncbi:MAG: hypothetical protein ABIR33_16580 [Pyrinomonadaceae bacterium]
MFEQHSYAFDVPAEPLREGDLFYKHEVGRWKFDNRLYAIVAGSAVFIFAFFGVVAQTPFLTARGCDSPFVGRVCQVLDMAYVGTMLYGTDREYIDAEYEKIDLKESEVVWIDQTGVPAQLEYPVGYFQLSNPEQFAAQQAMLNGAPAPYDFSTSGFPPISPPVQSGSSLIDTPAIKPKNNPKARPTNLPDSPFELPDDDSTADSNSNKGTTNVQSGKKPDADQTANANVQKPESPLTSDPVNAVDINRRPIEDLGNTVNDLIAKNSLNLQTPFTGSVKGKLNKDGRIDPKSLKLLIESSDPYMQKVVQEGVLAIDAAGFLKYLSLLSGRDLDMLLQQDDKNISATVQSEMESATRANTIRTGLQLLLTTMRDKKRNDPAADQNDKDDLAILEGAKVEVNGKKVVITFTVPKEVAHPMIQRKLAEQAAELKKPSGNAMTPHNSNTAAK